MTIKNLYPKARPQSIYNVINGRPELPAASTFSRASEATYVDANGLIQTAAVDEPRFNYDSETGEFLGLLLEGQTNNGTGRSDTAGVAASSGGPNSTGYIYTLQPGSPSGGEYLNMVKAEITPTNWAISIGYEGLNLSQNTSCIVSFWIRSPNVTQTTLKNPDIDEVIIDITPEWKRVYAGFRYGAQAMTLLFVRLDRGGSLPIGSSIDICNVQSEVLRAGSDWQNVTPMDATSYFRNTGTSSTVSTRAADAFSLTSSSNFDGGFSLLLDSETTTDDYFYKIKASGTTIAELNNANGTLDWVINGVSAATNGEYPQVGAIQPGRVRTISSFGAADGTTQQNYLYTEGLSFPTNAIVASGADEVEFGPGQTLKAVYLWNGQLSNTEAVSVIKGEYNIVPDEPIKTDSYSFVYNTDPGSTAETSITLPYIVPTISMRVYWGDGTNNAYEQGVTPSHTYPYPGQYRIQIEADDGFDAVRLGTGDRFINRVDQWAPQHRVNASGNGFTGDDMFRLLVSQVDNKFIPPFKYTDITTLEYTFYNQQNVQPNGWDWVPTELSECTTMLNCYRAISLQTGLSADRAAFPQSITSDKLLTVNSCFDFGPTGWVDENGTPTLFPWTNTSNVTDWSRAFSNSQITQIGALDTRSATDFTAMFQNCTLLGSMPAFQTGNVTTFASAFESCEALTIFPSIDVSSATNFNSAWYACRGLTSFPTLTLPSNCSFRQAWYACNQLTSFPDMNFNGATDFYQTWQNCIGLTSFPLIDTTGVTKLVSTWLGCNIIENIGVIPGATTSFPLIDTSLVDQFNATWYSCSGLTVFPAIDTGNGINFVQAWRNCVGIVSFPGLNFGNGESFANTWNTCRGLTDFPPSMFDTTGTLDSNAFDGAWSVCALTAQSIENILVSLDTNNQSNIQLGIDGGTNAGQSTWTTAANTAYTNLINKGWTIAFNA